MSFDNFEQKSLEHNTESAFQKLDSLHSAFEGSVESVGKFFGGFDVSTMKNVAVWLNIENVQFKPEVHKELLSMTKQMLDGGTDTNVKFGRRQQTRNHETPGSFLKRGTRLSTFLFHSNEEPPPENRRGLLHRVCQASCRDLKSKTSANVKT